MLLIASCGEKDTRDPLLIMADSGDAQAQFEWAKTFDESGRLEEAAMWYRRAANQNHNQAKRHLMDLLLSDGGNEKYVAEGLGLAKELAEAGIGDAKIIYANALKSGQYLDQDEETADRILRELISEGHPYGAYLKAAKLLEDEESPPGGTREVRSLLDTAAKAGFAEAQYLLARILEENGQVSDADKWYLEAAKQGHPHSMYKIGMAYKRLGDHPDYAPLGFDYLKKSFEAGVEEAVSPLALSYYNGVGTLVDKTKGLELMELGAALGQNEAIEFLLKLAYQDEVQGRKWDRSKEVLVSVYLRLSDDLDDNMARSIRSRVLSADSLFWVEVRYRVDQMDLLARQFRSAFDATVPALSPEEETKLNNSFLDRYGDKKALFFEAADARNPDSMFELAKLCFDEESQVHNPKEGFFWINQALVEKMGDAGYWVYQQFKKGTNPGFSKGDALNYLEKASRTPHRESKFDFAMELSTGASRDRNYEKAIILFSEASALGHPEARGRAKSLIRDGHGILTRKNFNATDTASTSLEGLDSATIRDFINEIKDRDPSTFVWALVKELADEGNHFHQFLWAKSEIDRYESQAFISTFRPIAHLANQIKSRVKGARNVFNFSWSSRGLGSITHAIQASDRSTIEEDWLAAVEEMERLSDEGYQDARYLVSGWRLFGFYGEKNENAAVDLWKSLAATEPASMNGKFLWGIALALGFHCEEDVIGGVSLIHGMAEQGHELAQLLFSDYNSKSKDGLFDRVYKATVLKEAESMMALALYFKDNKNYEKAYAEEQFFRWTSEAAKVGYPLALKMIGAAYFKGEKVEKNPLRGIRFLEQAAQSGDVQAQYEVGFFYTTNEFVSADYEKAKEYLTMAADQGHQDAITLISTLESLNRDSGVEGTAFRNAVISNALNQDFFPLKPVVIVNGDLRPVVDVRSRFPAYQDVRGTKASKKDNILYLAGERFGEGEIKVSQIEYTAPYILMENGWIYTGRDPSVTVICTTENPIERVYFLLVLRDTDKNFNYFWRPIGDMKPGKIYKRKISMDVRFKEAGDIAVYFFSNGQEIVTSDRRQLHYFLFKGLEAFTEKRTKYLKANAGNTLEPVLFEAVPFHLFGDLQYPSGFKAVFWVSKLGFVSNLELPDVLDMEARDRFYELFASMKFMPRLDEGYPVSSKVAISID